MGKLARLESGALAPAGAKDPYLEALGVWLEGRPPNTRRAYRVAIEQFLGSSSLHPRDVTPLDVARWKEHLKGRGLADSTIALKLSALSSYYAHLQRPGPAGAPIHPVNPVDSVGRDDLEVSPYGRARKVTVADFRAILDQADPSTVVGARNRAILLFYVLCARRRAEVVALRGRDIRIDGQSVVYRVRLKGGRVKWKELPPPVWQAITAYLDLAGRTLKNGTPLFVAHGDRGGGDVLRAHRGIEAPKGETPLTGAAVAQALRRYARTAGLEEGAVSLHSLRHLGAELFHKASGDAYQTQMFLDHAHLNTTQIYLDQLEGEKHRHWQAMTNALGVGDD